MAVIMRNESMKENKRVIRAFLRAHYTDERLGWLLAHAQSGKLAFFSCCCFVGMATADHAPRGSDRGEGWKYQEQPHYRRAVMLKGADDAEDAFLRLGTSEEERRRRIIPIVRAEMRRRAREVECAKCEGYHPAELPCVAMSADAEDRRLIPCQS